MPWTAGASGAGWERRPVHPSGTRTWRCSESQRPACCAGSAAVPLGLRQADQAGTTCAHAPLSRAVVSCYATGSELPRGSAGSAARAGARCCRSTCAAGSGRQQEGDQEGAGGAHRGRAEPRRPGLADVRATGLLPVRLAARLCGNRVPSAPARADPALPTTPRYGTVPYAACDRPLRRRAFARSVHNGTLTCGLHRNYLLPEGLAKLADESILAAIKAKREAEEAAARKVRTATDGVAWIAWADTSSGPRCSTRRRRCPPRSPLSASSPSK